MTNTLMTKMLIVSLYFLNMLTFNVSAQEKLYVFYPSTLHFQSLQDSLTNFMRGVNITVFDRYDSFAAKMKVEPPDAIITKPVLIKDQFSDYNVLLKGERNSNTEEQYVIISIDKPIAIESVNTETVIGIVDILGRVGMKSFSKQFFPYEPKLKRVPKIGDLLPLLSFDIAAGIMIEDVFVEYFKSTSQLQFAITPLPKVNNEIVAFAIKKDGNTEKTFTSLKNNDKKICKLFYIEQWK
jgi:hypothetical protein